MAKTNDQLSYTPATGYIGDDSFTNTVSDSNGSTDTATVTVTINGVNDLPKTFDPSLNLVDLDGSNGFVINGIDKDDRSGYSVSGAGDINGDGIDDLIIGARGAYPAGESYIVFGSLEGFNPSLELSALNGSNGFVINGIDINDFSNGSVSGAGDINGDGIDDLIVGSKYAGESYVVFGSKEGFNASLEPSDLNGNNGFVIKGIIDSGGFAGRTVSGAGDINGDGIEDFLLTFANGETQIIFILPL